jgi:hypothetical protein
MCVHVRWICCIGNVTPSNLGVTRRDHVSWPLNEDNDLDDDADDQHF